jgi:signal peptidase I
MNKIHIFEEKGEQTSTEILKTLSTEELEKELTRVRYIGRFARTLRSTINILITVAAVAVLVATLFLPVLQIYGSSMAPTLRDGEIVFSTKGSNFKKQDVVAFYYNNKILVKRVIACSGEWVDIDDDGNVSVNGDVLDEPYIENKALGECDIKLPYQVPEGKVFVMGDHRAISVDSRTASIGCISEEQIVGKLFFRIWPIKKIGRIDG